MKYSIPVLLLLCLFTSCEVEPTLEVLDNNFALKERITIPYQSSISIGSENIQISFEQVKEEARCPYEWDCLWAGHSSIKLTIQRGNEEANLDMMVQGRCDKYCGNTLPFQNYNIQLLKVLPYPKDDNYTPQSSYDDYEVVIVVTKENQHTLPAAVGIQS